MSIDLQAKEIKPLRHTFSRVQAYTGDKPASRYLEVTLDVQPTENFHYRPQWEPQYELFDVRRTALAMDDWNQLRDPRQLYYATWTINRARQQETVESNYKFVEQRGLLESMDEDLIQHVLNVLMPLRHVAWGGNMNNSAMCSRAYGAAFTAPALMHAMDHLGVAQFLTRLGIALGGATALDEGKQDWVEKNEWQPLRKYVEDSFVELDPFALFMAQNVVLDGLLYPLIYQAYLDGQVSPKGGTAVTMLTAFMPEWFAETQRWIDQTIKVLAAESDGNSQQLQQWFEHYLSLALTALLPIATMALGDTAESTLEQIRSGLVQRMNKAGLKEVHA